MNNDYENTGYMENDERPARYDYPPKVKRPVLTYMFLAVNVLVWILSEYFSKQRGVDLSLAFGGKFNPLIMGGEYWRFITPVFFHVDIIHLAVNSYSLYAVGPLVERLFGSGKFFIIYMTAGILGNVASFLLSTNLSIGASGALFGLMGALVYLIQKDRRIIKSSFGINVIVVILFNLVYGFTNARIDNYAHIGGLIGGYLTANAVGLFRERVDTIKKVLVSVLVFVLVFGGIYAGFNTKANIDYKNSYDLSTRVGDIANDAVDSYNNKEYSKSVELSLELLELANGNDKIKELALDLLASSLINQGNNEQAVEYAKELLQLNPKQGHYLLGVSYLNTGKKDMALEELKTANELDPENEQVKELLKELEG